MNTFILNKDHTVTEVNTMEWGRWMSEEGEKDRIIKQETIDGVRISTVFLGVDHSFEKGEPILFETMIFGGEHDEDQERYYTYEEALEGHKNIVKMCQGNKEIEESIEDRWDILDI